MLGLSCNQLPVGWGARHSGAHKPIVSVSLLDIFFVSQLSVETEQTCSVIIVICQTPTVGEKRNDGGKQTRRKECKSERRRWSGVTRLLPWCLTLQLQNELFPRQQTIKGNCCIHIKSYPTVCQITLKNNSKRNKEQATHENTGYQCVEWVKKIKISNQCAALLITTQCWHSPTGHKPCFQCHIKVMRPNL